MEAVLEEFTTETSIPAPETELEPQKEDRTGWYQLLYDILETVLLSAALFLVINALTARVRVDGYSMLPTLEDGNFVLVNRLAYRFGEPQRGDIIVFHFDLTHQDLIKRVVGLPGDEVRVENGLVYVNGVGLSETYIAAVPNYTGTWLVPSGNLFVLGDNRNDSSDSHSWGMLPFDKVVGKAVLVYWPFERWTMLDHVDLIKASQ
ncbi:MAG: signal peptidase I [Chloroflexi bacterium HGW-Chloroflexi-6]|nr:MAG: signal peptidase I [Chloroflexi bacterium HGW-Chloroflexi-6]